MEAAYESLQEDRFRECEAAPDLRAWFLVSGDADDFIFYGETEKNHSEK